jgi:hypothetical protein
MKRTMHGINAQSEIVPAAGPHATNSDQRIAVCIFVVITLRHINKPAVLNLEFLHKRIFVEF